MHINNNVIYDREVSLKSLKSSCFLIGPRMTGKTSLLKQLKVEASFDLLDPQMEIEFRTHPNLFWEEVSLLDPWGIIYL